MMTDKQWRDQTRRLWAKHKRAGVLMMRPRNKERTTKKWINVYMRTLHWIPDPETCICGSCYPNAGVHTPSEAR
jgi:hypothetical protein